MIFKDGLKKIHHTCMLGNIYMHAGESIAHMMENAYTCIHICCTYTCMLRNACIYAWERIHTWWGMHTYMLGNTHIHVGERIHTCWGTHTYMLGNPYMYAGERIYSKSGTCTVWWPHKWNPGKPQWLKILCMCRFPVRWFGQNVTSSAFSILKQKIDKYVNGVPEYNWTIL